MIGARDLRKPNLILPPLKQRRNQTRPLLNPNRLKRRPAPVHSLLRQLDFISHLALSAPNSRVNVCKRTGPIQLMFG